MTNKIIQQGARESKIPSPSKLVLLSQGAEAKIILDTSKNLIIKDRISKSYRHPELDKKIIKSRTKSETKLLQKASKIINCPIPENSKSFDKIIMPYIKGEKLSENLDNFTLEKQKEICREIGKSAAKLHKEDIIHGDLTTSNMILVEENESDLLVKKFQKKLIELKKLNIPQGKYALFGSAPLGVRGIRECRDIDVIVDENLWQEYKNKSNWEYKITENGIEHLSKGIIEFWPNWLPWYSDINKFIKNAEIIEGLPFVKLKYFIEWKKAFGREKDKRDIRLVEEYKKNLENNKKYKNFSLLTNLKKSDEQSEEHLLRAGQTKTSKIFFIDFGLGFISRKIEDKAVDLHLLKHALEAKHFKHANELIKEVFESYKKNYSEAEKIFERINAIEKRGRYRH